MATRKELIKNIKDYSPEEIAAAVRAGEISLYELSKETNGAFTPLLKKKVKAILDAPIPAEPLETTSPTMASKEEDKDLAASVVNVPPVPVPVEENPTQITTPSDEFQQKIDNPSMESASADAETISNKGMFKRPFSFKGRIRRTEYGISAIIYFIWYAIINGAITSGESGLIAFLLLTYIPMLWFMWAQNCKRCHDRGNSGWYQLIPFYVFVLLFGDGEPGVNEYGDNPKE